MKEESHIPHVCVHIIDPSTGYSMDPRQWIARPEDERKKAEWLHFQSSLGYEFNLHKKALPRGPWNEQLETAAHLCGSGRPGTRLEWLLIDYYERQSGVNINELLESIGGDPLSGFAWTEDEYRQCAEFAWYISYATGRIGKTHKSTEIPIRLITCE